eukprot:UN31805
MCGYYQTAAVAFRCQEWNGESSLDLLIGYENHVTEIPAGVKGLEITLQAEVDLDLKLFHDDLCLAGYSCLNPTSTTFTYNGMEITFSGDERVNPVEETIYVDTVTEDLTLTVRAYGNGVGKVMYSWDAIEPCPTSLVGCTECDQYAFCKDDLQPVCHGSLHVECVSPFDVITEQGQCDDYQRNSTECAEPIK